MKSQETMTWNEYLFCCRKSNKIMKRFDGISFMKEIFYAILHRYASFEVAPAIYFWLFICISATISNFIACDYLFIRKSILENLKSFLNKGCVSIKNQ